MPNGLEIYIHVIRYESLCEQNSVVPLLVKNLI
jgi:hypothetical protein